jgi:trans-aconitate methyltransferase
MASAIPRAGVLAATGPPPVPAFGAWAELYWRFRPIYPAAVFDLLHQATLGHHRLCVELGAGSGQATTCLMDRFDHVIAVEPDQAMARLLPDLPRLTKVTCPAEAYQGPGRAADAVVAASSLHWMDQDLVTGLAATWLRPGGVLFAFSYGAIQYPHAGAALHQALQRHAKRTRAHVDSRLSDFTPYATSISGAAAYGPVETFELYADHCWSGRELAGFLLSTSYGQALAASTGDADGYFEALCLELTAAATARPITVRFPIEGAFARAL